MTKRLGVVQAIAAPWALGRLLTPRHCSDAAATTAAGLDGAADNDAYSAWDEGRFLRMVERLAGVPGCRFVTCPDSVGEAGLTDLLFQEYAPIMHRYGVPVGYALQNAGVEYEAVGIPWGAIDAVFIGGDDAYKLGGEVQALVAEAKRRGKWVHMGRVNTIGRLRYAASIGCDSVDGTKWVRWTDTYIDQALGTLAEPPQPAQLRLGFA